MYQYEAVIRKYDSHGLTLEEEERVQTVIQEKCNLLYNNNAVPSYTSLSPLLESSEIGQDYDFVIGNNLGVSREDRFRPHVMVDLLRPQTLISRHGVRIPTVMATKKPAIMVDFCGGPGAGAGVGVVHAGAGAAPLVFAAAIVLTFFLTF